MNLYLVHCGFYDASICDGLFEGHANYFVAAENIEEARIQAKLLPEYKEKRMHVDGLQEIHSVNGFKVHLQFNAELNGATKVIQCKNRELASNKN
ncbi:MAG: DUF1543 domain-containing protein [Pseudobdellovibrionaceae bacterium]